MREAGGCKLDLLPLTCVHRKAGHARAGSWQVPDSAAQRAARGLGRTQLAPALTQGALELMQSSCDETPQGISSWRRPRPQRPRPSLTHSLAGLGVRVQLEALLTVTLVAALEVHAQLAAHIGVLTLVDICKSGHTKAFGASSPWDADGSDGARPPDGQVGRAQALWGLPLELWSL